ncbi:hypothetical protein N2152v2_002391 [Parachlorella kessleri]
MKPLRAPHGAPVRPAQGRASQPPAAQAQAQATATPEASVSWSNLQPGALESDLSTALSLANIRQSLIRQEDTIIFSLIERAQFARNDAVYQWGGVSVPAFMPDGRQYTFLEYLLRETEQVHGKIRRYTSPDEHAYFPDSIPPLVIPPISFPQVLAPCSARVNINDQIMTMYLEHLLPEITQPGDDHNYGSAAMYDVMILQALSKRIHFGKFVAEAKFKAQPEKYTQLIQRRDAQGILDTLTDRAVELKASVKTSAKTMTWLFAGRKAASMEGASGFVIDRVRRKAATFGQDLDDLAGPSNSNPPQHSSAQHLHSGGSSSGGSSSSNGGPASHGASFKIKPEAVAELYEQWVMPLTKEVEVQYLLQRLDEY